MPGKIAIVVCDNLRREAREALESSGLDDVLLLTFRSDCVRPPAGWERISASVASASEGPSQVHVIGGRGCVPAGDPPSSLGPCQIHRLEQCAHLFLDRRIADSYAREGAYLLTPGWLARWQQYLNDWGFDQKTAREFFREFATRLVLLDTGVDAGSAGHLRELADFLGLPSETEPIGLDSLRWRLENVVLRWRLAELETAPAVTPARDERQAADYAMAFDMVNSLAGIMNEPEAIEKILDLFTALFAPGRLAYLPVDGARLGAVRVRPGAFSDPGTLTGRLAGLKVEHAWTESGDGFLVSIEHLGERLAVLEVDGLALPQYKESYLNLAVTIARLCGLAVFNARTYEKMRRTEEALDAQRERLAVTLRSIGDGLISVDTDGTVVLLNQVAETLTGWPNDEAVGRPLAEVFNIVNEKTRRPAENPVEKALSTGRIVGLANNTALIARDGTEKLIADSAAPVLDRQGRTIGVVLVFRDVTQRRLQARQLRALQSITEAALSHLAMDEMLTELLSRLRNAVGTDTATILLADDKGEYLEVGASSGLEEEVAHRTRIPVGEGVAGRIASSRQPLIVDDLAKEEGSSSLLRQNVRSLVGAPLMIGGRLIGVIHVGTLGQRRFNRDDVRLLTLVAERAAVAIERSRLYEAEQAARADAEAARRQATDILESITDAFFALDREWRITYVNREAEPLLRKSREELMGHVLWEEFPEAVGTTFYNEYHRAMEQQSPVTFEDYYPPFETWFEVHAYPSKTGLSVYFQDITERKEIEEGLRKLSRAVEQSPVTVVITDTAGNIEYVNPKFVETTGYTLEETIGQNPRLLKSGEMPPEGYQELWDTITSGREWRGEFHNKRKNGELYWEAASISPIRDASGKITHFLAVKEDITQRKRAEEAQGRLAAIVESSDDAIISKNLDGIILSWNPGAKRLYGYSENEVIGKSLALLTPPHLHDDLSEILERLKRGEHIDHYETQRVRKDGRLIDVSVSVSAIRGADGRIIGASTIARDITERKRVEEEIKRLNQHLQLRAIELDAANKELEAFSYSVSHDLRAPLRHIDGFSKALLEDYEDKLDEEGRDFLHRVRAASQRMAQLIDDMLTLSRVTRKEMRRHRVDLSALARNVAAELMKDEPERRVNFAIQPGLAVLGDADLLRVVLNNLFGNAWKFTSKRTSAEIEFGATERDGTTVFFVRDNGVGFDMTYVGKLFGAFQRLHTEAEFPGTGVGLATVQRIIRRHGGQVWAESAPDRGATFYFTIPG